MRTQPASLKKRFLQNRRLRWGILRPLRISESAEFLVESVMPGMRYRVFDLNGVYLYDGTWQGSFKAQGKPVLVRFENGQTAVFR